jgi:hypothetical protein
VKSHHLIIAAGALAGLIVGVIWQTEPRFLGWTFGLGLGLLGGAFIAALTSGAALGGSGAKRTRREREWLLRGDEDDGQHH